MKSINVSSTNKNTVKLTVCAIMVALSTVLSFIKFAQLPYGGSVTLFSFVPVLFAGYAYGVKWGIGSGIVYGILQTIFGISDAIGGAGFKWWQILLCAFLDYILAGAMLGTADTFKKVIKSPHASFAVGTVFACVMKYLSHFLSGFIIFGSYAEWFFGDPSSSGAAYGAPILASFSGKALSAVYSLIYNALFSVPELVISIIVAMIIISVKPIRNICEQ